MCHAALTSDTPFPPDAMPRLHHFLSQYLGIGRTAPASHARLMPAADIELRFDEFRHTPRAAICR